MSLARGGPEPGGGGGGDPADAGEDRQRQGEAVQDDSIKTRVESAAPTASALETITC